MHVINARNVNDAFISGLRWLQIAGVDEDTRNGPVKVSICPVTTVYQRPRERVLFDTLRDANPFFHLFESVWMLAGSNKVAPVARFNSRMAEYSDDGETLHAAYGQRWRLHFGFDQLIEICRILRRDPLSRRAVIAMWNPGPDTEEGHKDLPCNTHIYFRNNGGSLDMTVCCRSNDVVWGAYGANAVHFSILQEVISNELGWPIGRMYQISNNYHIYKSVPNYDKYMAFPTLRLETPSPFPVTEYMDPNPYDDLSHQPPPCILGKGELQSFLYQCEEVVERKTSKIKNPWLQHVVLPIINLWESRNLSEVSNMLVCDWSIACKQWVERRQKRERETSRQGPSGKLPG